MRAIVLATFHIRINRRPDLRQRPLCRALGHPNKKRIQYFKPKLIIKVFGQVRLGNSGVSGHRDTIDVFGLETALQFIRKEQVGQFRAGIGFQGRIVFSALEKQVVKIHLSPFMGVAAYVNHPRIRGTLNEADEMSGQGKMPKMVGAVLRFQAIFCQEVGRCHDAGIVEQNIQPVVLRFEDIGEMIDGGQFHEIQRHDCYFAFGVPHFAFSGIALFQRTAG